MDIVNHLKDLNFDVGANNAENYNDSFIKLTFEVEGLSDMILYF